MCKDALGVRWLTEYPVRIDVEVAPTRPPEF
jgi:hypothetical protein